MAVGFFQDSVSFVFCVHREIIRSSWMVLLFGQRPPSAPLSTRRKTETKANRVATPGVPMLQVYCIHMPSLLFTSATVPSTSSSAPPFIITFDDISAGMPGDNAATSLGLTSIAFETQRGEA